MTRPDTEGVVQETFLHLFSYSDTVHTPMAWLCTVARRIVARCHAEALRSAYGDPAEHLERGVVQWNSIAPTAELEDILAVREVMDALACLPDRQRTAVYLRHVQGWSLAEIGAYLDCAAATAGVHIHRARLALTHEKASTSVQPGAIAGGSLPARARLYRWALAFVPALMVAISIYLFLSAQPVLAALTMAVALVLGGGVFGVQIRAAAHYWRRRHRQPGSRPPSD